MGNPELKIDKSATSVSAVRLAQWTMDKMIEKNAVRLQGLMYSQNLLPEQLEHLYIIYMQEQNAYSRIRNITEIYGEEDAISSLKYASYNIQHYLNAVVKHVLRLTSDHNIEIIASCDSNCKSAVFDLRRMSLILYNLISNSIIHNKYKKKVINVRAFMRGSDFVVSVRDNGRGIAPAIRRNMFSAYENKLAVNFTSPQDAGFVLGGLGLSVCKKAAKEMSGDVVYIPSKMGGTEFELIIPQKNRHNMVGDTVIAEPDINELSICLSGAILHLRGKI